MIETEKESKENLRALAHDVEFLPLVLIHKVHRQLRASQVEIFPVPYYLKELTPEPEPERETKGDQDLGAPVLVYAPPLPALKECKNWWDFVKPVYAFNKRAIRSRLEKLMNSNIVPATDRKYMVRLQERIREEYDETLSKRILDRKADETEREKKLLLEGKVAFDDVPKELMAHPICRINLMARRILQNKKSKMKILEKTGPFKTSARRIREAELAMSLTVFDRDADEESGSMLPAPTCDVDADLSEDVERGFMFSIEDYQNHKYEDPLITELRGVDGVNDLYELADQIMGEPKYPKKDEKTLLYVYV